MRKRAPVTGPFNRAVNGTVFLKVLLQPGLKIASSTFDGPGRGSVETKPVIGRLVTPKLSLKLRTLQCAWLRCATRRTLDPGSSRSASLAVTNFLLPDLT